MNASVFARFGIDTVGIGEDSGQPVTADYTAPFRFNGAMDQVVVDLKPMADAGTH